MTTFTRCNFDDVDFTSLQGYIRTTYDQLKSVLGDPVYEDGDNNYEILNHPFNYISPYLLKENGGFWYLIGYNHGADSTQPPVIVLALHRIKKLMEANLSFEESTDFNPKEYFKYSLGVFHHFKNEPIEVKFWASEVASDFLNLKKLHNSQKILETMDIGGKAGQIYQIKVYDSDELLHLFLSRAENYRVLEPKSLVDTYPIEASSIL